MAESAGRDGQGAAAGGSEEVEDRGESGALLETGESDDEEDVFEVERIIDSKIEEGQVLYRVRWKNYDSDADTWEPEGHLDTCREVLLEFRRKQAEAKQKAAKKETPPRLSSSDLFEAESDSDFQEEMPQKKKKKKTREEDEEQLDEVKKKKSKSGKSKEKSKTETEPSESQPPESKPKKRSSEHKEDLSSKKPKKEDKDSNNKESKKSKKEGKDAEAKGKEEVKEKKSKKSSGPETPRKGESSPLEPETETLSVCSDVISDEKDKPAQEVEVRVQDTTPPHAAEEPAFAGPEDEEMDDVKLKKKKKKHKKKHEDSKASLVVESHKASLVIESQQDTKKSQMKKQKMVEKLKEAFTDKLPSPVQKSPRPSADDKIRKSVDSLPEVNASAKPVQPKEAKKAEMAKEKERPKKRHDFEKEAKKESERKILRQDPEKEPKVIKTVLKEQKPVQDAFTVSADDREECMESSKERPPPDSRLPEDHKMKGAKPVLKERRSTQDETDSWTFGAVEGDQEVMDTMCRGQDNSGLESRNQVSAMTMDLQLEWMTLEDFQRHLDGADEIIPKDPISSSALKEAVKNGDYLTVKYALNSDEEYNLDQEDSSGMTLVMMAAAAGQDDILRILIKKGAKVNARQKNGTTALMHAAEKNYLTTVAVLLDAGAFVNVQQVTGETALMKACKRGNYDIARLLIEQGADCNMLSKHQGNALQFAKQSNVVLLFELINGHLEKLSRVVEDAIKDYFEARLVVLEAVFPIACHRLCEGPDFSLDFNYKPPHNTPADSGILLFVFHANFIGKEVVVRLCGSCSVQAVVLNDKFQLPVFLDAHFIYSFSPVAGANKLFIRLSEVPSAKVKLLICAYRVQLH